jgi:hypothetical protein
MPDRLTSYISIPAPIIVQEKDTESDRVREIEALEVDNFELRDRITSLKLHNATLRRMLDIRERRPAGRSDARSGWNETGR